MDALRILQNSDLTQEIVTAALLHFEHMVPDPLARARLMKQWHRQLSDALQDVPGTCVLLVLLLTAEELMERAETLHGLVCTAPHE